MINIVGFKKTKYDTVIGYRVGKAVVYASVDKSLSDLDAKQRGYELVYNALAYEAKQSTPSIDGSNMPSLGTLTPAASKVKTVFIKGPSYYAFEDASVEKSLSYTVEAKDQYGNIIEKPISWIGTINGTLTVKNTQANYDVSVVVEGIRSEMTVQVVAYSDSASSVAIEEKVVSLNERIGLTEQAIDFLIMNGGV